MNVIDALVITLGLDTREYEKKQKDVTTSLKKFSETSDKQTKLIAEQGKKAAGAFSALKIEILGALAAFGMGAGFKAFVQDNMNGQAALGRMSKTLGMSAHQLQAWKLAAKEMGGAGSEATDALQSVAKGMAEAKIHGTSALIQASRRFGFDVSNDPAQTLVNISRRMAQMHDPQQALQIAEAAGISNFTMQQMLLQGPEKLQAQLAHTMAITGAATKESTEQAAKLQAQWADVQERFRQVGERVFNKLEPALDKLATRFADWLDSIDWDKVIADIGTFIDKVQHLVEALGGVKGILIDIAAIKVFGWVASIGGWVIQLRALTAALVAARAASAAGAAGEVAGSAGMGGLMRLAPWALPIWALFHSESLGGKQRADGTYEDEALSAAALSAAAKDPRAAAFQRQQRNSASVGRDEAIRYFLSQGFSRNAAIGMAANIARESSFNPFASGDNGQAYGIGQWHPSRQADFARVMGLPIQASSFQQQLAFYAYEVRHNKRLMDQLAKDPSAASAAMLVSMLNERPADMQGEAQKRAILAQQMATAYATRTAGSAASTNTNTVSIGTMNVNAPKATDANGIAKGMRRALQSNPLIAGSVTALA
ncbi:MAG: phage tail tip lysozyme [Rhodanobacteraceae bacterium]